MSSHYHFIGIGGMGMGPLALLMRDQGFKVSGSDLKENALTERLRQKGAVIYKNHNRSQVRGANYVVYSSAISSDNPELLEAQSQGIPILKRAQLLAQLMNDKKGIAIAGAHGKTTTTSMISNLLIRAGFHPTSAVGGIIKEDSYHAQWGKGELFVAELDESDGSFLYFAPLYSVITNIDFEHVDYYRSWENILSAYRQFIEKTRPEGLLIIYGEDERLQSLVKASGRKRMSYGEKPQNDIYADQIHLNGLTSCFRCLYQGKLLGKIELQVPGRHNVLNALACVCLGLTCDIPFLKIRDTLKEFRGVERRFEIKSQMYNIWVVDDYGHHPTEIRKTLEAARSLARKRIITVFQPHRYTRTKLLFNEFVDSLRLSDYLIITDIYAAGEPAIEGVHAQILCERIQSLQNIPVIYLPREKIVPHLLEIVQEGDMVLTLGAGDVNKIAPQFIEAYSLTHQGSCSGG